jgi:pilus assembly protein CpaE
MKGKILVVDDDPDALRLTAYALELEGYETLTAENGSQALAAVERDLPNLVVLDVMMPDMSGIEVCRHLRSDPDTQHLPIIMLSAKGKAQDKVTGLKAGADDYVAKPTDPAELVARVERLLLRAAQLAGPKAQVMALVGAKGGVGTTTVAVNLGVALAQLGKATLLADMGMNGGGASYMLGLAPDKGLESLAVMDVDRISSREVERRTIKHRSGLRLLAQAKDIPAAERQTLSASHAAATLQVLASMSEWVLLDLHTAWLMAAPAVTMLERCDIVVLVAEADPLSLACAQGKLASLLAAGVLEQELAVVLVHRSSATMTVPQRALQEQLGNRVVAVVPPASEAFLESLKQQIPLVMAKPQEYASQVLVKMAQRLIDGVAA